MTFGFEPAASSVRIEIYNSTGTLLRVSDPTTTGRLQMNLGDLAPGIYLYRLISFDRVLDSGKIIK
ncbi:MAG: T9SS type A sorting domain-containing protein [Bacteroidota bacterium]